MSDNNWLMTGMWYRYAGNATPVHYHSDRFSSSSNARNGTLRPLADANQPSVDVGNIIGDYPDDDPTPDSYKHATTGTGREPAGLQRVVTVDPLRVYVGDGSAEAPIHFTITFEAPGPMYGGELQLTVPTHIQPGSIDD